MGLWKATALVLSNTEKMFLLLLKSPWPFKLQFSVVCSDTHYKQCRLVCLQTVWLLQIHVEERDERAANWVWFVSSHDCRRCASFSSCYFNVTAPQIEVVHEPFLHFLPTDVLECRICAAICLYVPLAGPFFLKLPPHSQPKDKLPVVSAGSLCNNPASRIYIVDAVLPCLQAEIWLFMLVHMSIRWNLACWQL